MAHDIQILRPKRVLNNSHHWVGLFLMALNRFRHQVRGYRTPRTKQWSGLDAALRYDRAVVNDWLTHFDHYLGYPSDLSGLDVLEIGPGPDLGTGMFLLAKGARSYTAVDAHRLIHRSSLEHQRSLATAIAQEEVPPPRNGNQQAEALVEQLERCLDGDPDRLRYVVIPDFNLDGLEERSADLVLGHSSFEHLSDVAKTIRQLGRITRPGGHLISEIDLQTHTRWIRDADPLNIYRYRSRLYRALSFSGSPNRFRPDDYVEALDAEDWTAPRLYPRRVLERDYVRHIEPSLAPSFRGDLERIGWLSMVLCATRAGGRKPKVRRG